MRHDPVNVARLKPRLAHRALGDSGHVSNRVFENGMPVHADKALARGQSLHRRGHGRAAGLDVKQRGERAVRASAGRENPVVGTGLGRLNDRGAGSVAEQNARRAVRPVSNCAHFLGADDKDLARGAGANVLPSDVQSVEKATARRKNVEGRGVGKSELLLHQARRGRKRRIARDRRDHQEVDFARFGPGRGQRPPTGLRRHVGSPDVISGYAPTANSSPGVNPLVRRIDHLREVVVGKRFLRKKRTCARNHGANRKTIHLWEPA